MTSLNDGKLQGEELQLNEAEAVKALGFAYIDTHCATNAAVQIDLSGLAKANSITVAVLMAWYRYANNLGLQISFAHLSPSLCKIINFSGLHEVLIPEPNQAN